MAIAAPFPSAASGSVRVRTDGGRAARTGARSRAAHSGKTWRLTRRGRMVLGVLLSVPFAAVLMVIGSLSADAGTAGAGVAGQAATGVVVVQPGESLWQIAREVAPQADPRATLSSIRELNGLDGNAVVPGQSLVVPVGA